MRTTAMAAAGAAALLAGATGVTTTAHATGLLGLGGSQHAHRLLSTGGLLPFGSGGLLSLGNGSLLACANVLHAGGINLIGSGKQLGIGCSDTRLGAGYGTNLLTLPPLPATPFLGRCQTFLQNVGGMLPLIGFPINTGAGLQTSCDNHPSPLDPLTSLLGLG